MTYNNRIQWLEGAKVLTIANITVDEAGNYTCVAYTSSNITVDEAGNYTCVAYTSGPIRSEDQASATIDVSGIKVLFLWYI